MAAGIIKQAGGADNIVSATHCMTRLRLVLRDRSKFDTDAVKQVPGVLNVIIQNGEYQVVIGQDVPDLYEEVVKIDGIQAGGSVQDDEAAAKDLAQDHGNIGNAILSFIGGTFSPVIPVLVAGGLTGAVLSLLTNVFGVSTESGTYTIFYAINQATFYFLPIFIGFAAAARLKSMVSWAHFWARSCCTPASTVPKVWTSSASRCRLSAITAPCSRSFWACCS